MSKTTRGTEDRELPQGHIELTRRSWQWIRQGLTRCIENAGERQRCLQWCAKFPEYTATWTEILQGGHQEMVHLALHTEDYFDLPQEAMDWWERILQNHPFAVLFSRENYAALQKKRKANSEKCA